MPQAVYIETCSAPGMFKKRVTGPHGPVILSVFMLHCLFFEDWNRSDG